MIVDVGAFDLVEGGQLAIYRSAILAAFPWLVHGFTTRRGGVSEGGYASLNLGAGSGDDPARVAENRRRLSALAGIEPHRIRTARQVHGREVAVLSGGDGEGTGPIPGVDGLVTAVPGLAPLVLSADCALVLMVAPDQRAVAAVHAGWRGTVAGASAAAVRTLVEVYGAVPTSLVAAVGPAIGPCCYEVDRPVIEAVHAAFPEDAEALLRPTGPGKAHFDLWAANRLQLERAGLLPEHIAVAGLCTRCHPDRFYSQRRDGLTTGRFGAFIVVH
jgi:hypothetical protein